MGDEHGEHLTIVCLNGFLFLMVTWQTCLFFLFWGEEHDKWNKNLYS
jgi:hypothetical protein